MKENQTKQNRKHSNMSTTNTTTALPGKTIQFETATIAYDKVMEIITPLSLDKQYLTLRLLTNWLESKEAEICKENTWLNED